MLIDTSSTGQAARRDSRAKAIRRECAGSREAYLCNYIMIDDTDLCGYINRMEITFDPAKRNKTLAERGLDFADAAEVFAGPVFEAVDNRHAYGEVRIITIGFLRGRMVVVGWTPRGQARHVFTMRKANEREQERYGQRFEAG